MQDNKHKTALITGASSGIGLELAKLHAQNGDDLVLVARRKEKLQELQAELEEKYDITVTLLVKDLAQESAAREIYDEVHAKNIEIDYLINNAGFGGHGKFHEREWAKDAAMIQVNVTVLTALTRFFLDDMVKRDSGRILNVASTAGFLPGPLQAVYYATKAFVVSFSEALAEELSDTNISVSALCPGPTESEFAKTGDLEETNLFKQKTASAHDVAKHGFDAMMKGKVVAFDRPFFGFALRRILPLMPRKMVLKGSRQVMEQN